MDLNIEALAIAVVSSGAIVKAMDLLSTTSSKKRKMKKRIVEWENWEISELQWLRNNHVNLKDRPKPPEHLN